MFERIQDAINLKLVQAVAWLQGLPPGTQWVVAGAAVALMVLLVAAGVHFGLLPTKGIHYDPLIHW